jgi:hypothetical protein
MYFLCVNLNVQLVSCLSFKPKRLNKIQSYKQQSVTTDKICRVLVLIGLIKYVKGRETDRNKKEKETENVQYKVTLQCTWNGMDLWFLISIINTYNAQYLLLCALNKTFLKRWSSVCIEGTRCDKSVCWFALSFITRLFNDIIPTGCYLARYGCIQRSAVTLKRR